MSRAFDGTVSHIVLAASDPANAGAFSISLQSYRGTDAGVDHALAGKSALVTTNPGDWLFYNHVSTAKYLLAVKFNGGADGLWSIPRPSVNVWHHVGFGYDGSSSANDPDMVVDGTLQTVTRSTGPSGSRTTITDNVGIGNREAADIGWNGSLAEFGMWNRKLSVDEWKALGQGYSPLFFPLGLIEYIPMWRDVVSFKNAQPTVTGTTVSTLAPYKLILPTRVLVPAPSLILPTSFTADAILIKTTGVAFTADSTIGTPPLPIGGNEALRGPQSYTLLTPNATVAAPYGITQVNAAKAAAGVGGVVRLPHAGSPFNFGWDLDVAGQTWQCELPTTIVSNTSIGVKANNVTWQSGTLRNAKFVGDGNVAVASSFLLKDTYFDQLGTGDQSCINAFHFERLGNWIISQCKFTDNGPLTTGTNNFRGLARLDYPDDVLIADGFRVEHTIIERAAGHGGDTISGSDNQGTSPDHGRLKNFVVHNCRFDGGDATTSAAGWFGIEVWRCVPNAAGIGGIVQYSDLYGGTNVLMSMVRSTNNWIHHNTFKTRAAGGPFGTYESAGPNHTGLVFENNELINTSQNGCLIYHNNGSHHNTIRFNKIKNIDTMMSASGAQTGGAYTIEDNCLQPLNNGVFQASSTWQLPNIVNRNGPNDGPCAIANPTFTADSVLKKILSATYTADGVLRKAVVGSYTADGVLFKVSTVTFTANGVISAVGNIYHVTADAMLVVAVQNGFTADAVLTPSFYVPLGGVSASVDTTLAAYANIATGQRAVPTFPPTRKTRIV